MNYFLSKTLKQNYLINYDYLLCAHCGFDSGKDACLLYIILDIDKADGEGVALPLIKIEIINIT